MCCERNACRPLVRQMVFFSSPPTASTDGTSSRRKTGTGTNPRERRNCRGRPPETRDYGVITAQQNVAVVNQEAVGQSLQPAHCLVIRNANRLLAQVGAGHHQRRKPPPANSR